MPTPAILIVEDDPEVADFIYSLLTGKGYRTLLSKNAKEGLQMARQERPSCMVIDWILGEMSGLELSTAIRKESNLSTTPILMMSGKKLNPEDLSRAIDAGADDFLTKPFNSIVFLSKISAMIRRASWQDPASVPSEIIRFKNLSINCTARSAAINGSPLHLTYNEYELLLYLLRHTGVALDRPTLLRAISDHPEEVYQQVVDKHIENIRKKLGSLGKHLETVRNVGYRLG